MKHPIQLISLCVMFWLFAGQASAFTVTGRIQYNRNYNGGPGYQFPGSEFPTASWSGVYPLKGVKVCATRVGLSSCNSDGLVTHGFTDDNGDFTLVVNNPIPGSGWLLEVKFVGRSQQTVIGEGYRLVASSGSTTPLKSTIGPAFNPNPNIPTNLGTLTFQPCVPAAANCPNDRANGFSVLNHMVGRWTSFYGFAGMTNYVQTADAIAAYTDGQSALACGTAGTESFCFNYDFGSTYLRTAFHEGGHQLFGKWRLLNGASIVPGVTGCPGQTGGSGDATGGPGMTSEAEANLNSILMVYNEHDSAGVTNLSDFCSAVSQDPEGVNPNQSCSACEFLPNNGLYPIPLACGTVETSNIQRTECRGLRAYIDIIDDVAVNGASCLSESLNKTYAQFANVLNHIPDGTGEGQGSENQVGAPVQGNAVATHDAFSIMDIIVSLPGATTNDKWRIWQNSCSMPGDANWPSNTFLPANGRNPPF